MDNKSFYQTFLKVLVTVGPGDLRLLSKEEFLILVRQVLLMFPQTNNTVDIKSNPQKRKSTESSSEKNKNTNMKLSTKEKKIKLSDIKRHNSPHRNVSHRNNSHRNNSHRNNSPHRNDSRRNSSPHRNDSRRNNSLHKNVSLHRNDSLRKNDSQKNFMAINNSSRELDLPLSHFTNSKVEKESINLKNQVDKYERYSDCSKFSKYKYDSNDYHMSRINALPQCPDFYCKGHKKCVYGKNYRHKKYLNMSIKQKKSNQVTQPLFYIETKGSNTNVVTDERNRSNCDQRLIESFQEMFQEEFEPGSQNKQEEHQEMIQEEIKPESQNKQEEHQEMIQEEIKLESQNKQEEHQEMIQEEIKPESQNKQVECQQREIPHDEKISQINKENN